MNKQNFEWRVCRPNLPWSEWVTSINLIDLLHHDVCMVEGRRRTAPPKEMSPEKIYEWRSRWPGGIWSTWMLSRTPVGPDPDGDCERECREVALVLKEMSPEKIHEIFRANCVSYPGNYEVTPGQSHQIVKAIYEYLSNPDCQTTG